MNPGTLRTTLTAGSVLNFTWHLGYPHRGGYRLELMNPAENLALLLVPEKGNENSWQEGRTDQSHQVTLPTGVECDQCYLKFQRQALEWGQKYKFRSCADISLVSGGNLGEQCSGAGKKQGGECVCDRGREGHVCQYKTDCQTDQDCNGPKGQGKCLDVESTIFPFKQCFCAGGWYGPQCQHKARWEGGQAKEFNKPEFTEVKLGANAVLYWKVAGEEVEMVVTAQTNSWVGLGWRPASATKSCQKFPEEYPKPRGTDFNGMDCMDMVIGVAREGRGKVGDFYTRDRSTPREDTFWGGEDDLVSSHAWEEDGQTTMRFVKKMSGGVADHPLQGKLTLIWAYGQNTEFYKPDQLKYHSKPNRGFNVLELGEVSSSPGVGPVTIGISVSVILLMLLLGLQILQNFDKKLSCLTPSSYKSFSPEN